jgi:hypothetical protein
MPVVVGGAAAVGPLEPHPLARQALDRLSPWWPGLAAAA